MNKLQKPIMSGFVRDYADHYSSYDVSKGRVFIFKSRLRQHELVLYVSDSIPHRSPKYFVITDRYVVMSAVSLNWPNSIR